MRIVPGSRLLYWVALIGVPAATLGLAVPGIAHFATGLGIVLVCAVVADALAGVVASKQLAVSCPALIRTLKGVPVELELTVRNPGKATRLIRLAPELPAGLVAMEDTVRVLLPSGAELSALRYRLVADRRGRFLINRCYYETGSPLGFWDLRYGTALEVEVRVYPNLRLERAAVAAMFLNRGTVGVHAQRQVGKGREFEKLREYLPGDAVDDIHWKASAKRGQPVTKVFQLERTQEVYIVIDASRLSGRAVSVSPPVTANIATLPGAQDRANATPGPAVTALEQFVSSALILAAAAERKGDLVGLVTFSDRIETFLHARNGKAHYSACRDALYTLEPQLVAPDFEELFTFLRLRLRRRALLVFLTALDDPALAESFVRNVELVRRQHLVLVNMIRPTSAAPLFAEGEVATLDDVYAKLGGHLIWRELLELQGLLKARGVGFELLDGRGVSAQLVSQYLTVKQRQLL